MRKSGPFYMIGFVLMVGGILLSSVPIALVGTALGGIGIVVEYVTRD